MSLDGLTYSSIARNLAEGVGSFWKPYYTETVYRTFYEHPPFGFLLQSFAFDIFGEALYVEAFYGFAAGIVIIGLIALIWQSVGKGQVSAGVWLPVLLFVSLPMTSWSLANNMLENTMAVFVLLAVLLAVLSIRTAVTAKLLIYGLLSGVSIFLAFLTKGPGGVFPIVVPLAWMLTVGDATWKRTFISTLAIASGMAISAVLIVLPNPDGIAFFDVYFTNQVFRSLAGVRETASSHFGLLKRLLSESLVPLSFCLVIYLIKRTRFNLLANKKLFFLALVSISGSFPLLISPKQMSWYLFPSLPFYSLAFAALFENSARLSEAHLLKSRRLNIVFYCISSALLIAAVAWMITEKGVVRKGRDFHEDFSLQKCKIEERITISAYPPQLATNWGLVANMQRQFKVSLSDSFGHVYLISTVGQSEAGTLRNNYKKIHPPKPSSFILYKRIK